MSPELEGQGFSKKLGSAKKKTNNVFIRQNLQRRQDNRLYVMKWWATRGRPCHGFLCDACCVNLEFEFLNQLRWVGCASNQGIIATHFLVVHPHFKILDRRNEGLGYQVLLSHNRGNQHLWYVSASAWFSGYPKNLPQPLFSVWGKHIRKPHLSSLTAKNRTPVFREKKPKFQIWWTLFRVVMR